MRKLENLIWLYLIIASASFFIYVNSEFILSITYQNILISIEILILLVFSFYLIKNVKTKKINYSLDSFNSYIGIIGINLIIFGLFHFGLMYPLSYALHKVTKKSINIEMKIVNKADYISSTQYLKKYRYKFWLKNNNFEKVVYLNDKQISKIDFEKIKIYEIMILNVEKSFFGYTINELSYETKD